jgi:hypothetical protein
MVSIQTIHCLFDNFPSLTYVKDSWGRNLFQKFVLRCIVVKKDHFLRLVNKWEKFSLINIISVALKFPISLP